MHETNRLTMWGRVAVLACSLSLPIVSPQLSAEEPASMDNHISAPTSTVTDMPTPAPQDHVISTPSSTEQYNTMQPQENQLLSAPTLTAERVSPSRVSPSEQNPQYTPLPGQMGREVDKRDRTGGGMIKNDEVLTLSRCIDIALGKNPNIVAAMNFVDVTSSRVGEARSAYYPQVTATGEYSSTKPLNTSTNRLTAYNQYTGSVVVNQTIYDFGRTSSSVNISKYNLDSSRADLNATQNQIMLNVKQTYYGVLQAKRNRDVALDVIKQFQLHLDQAKGFYDVGTVAKIDVIKAEVDLSNAKLSLINAENALKIAWVNLNIAMGIPDAPEYAIEDNLSFQQYAISLEDATTKAFDNRPDLKSIIAKRQAAEENISLQRSGYLPILSGIASYNQAGPPENEPPTQPQNEWNAGVIITFPLFSGFLTNYQVAEAKANLYVLRANEETVRQQTLLDVRQAFLNLQAAEASIPTAELALSQAKENLDIANGRYGAGVGSPIEVSDAFATYVTAQASYNNALYNYKIAQANIEKAMGER
jgi:outer membrane protein